MEKTDLAAFLSEIVSENTKRYAEDLQYDIRRLFHAAKKPNMEDKSFYWMSRPNGTWCVKERNVFLQAAASIASGCIMDMKRKRYALTASS